MEKASKYFFAPVNYIEIIDTKTLQTVWKDSIISKKHDGGLPTSIFDIPFISFSSGMNIGDTSTFDIVENTCRILAYRIPSYLTKNKKVIKNKGNNVNCFLQTGSFLDKTKSIALLKKLRNMELPAFIKQFNDKNKIWYRVLLGPFESLQETNMLRDKIKNKLKVTPIIKKSLDTK